MSSNDRGAIRVGALLLACAACASACVTSGTHDAIVKERDLLARETTRLSAALSRLDTTNESLSAERLQLIDELETIRDERDVLRVEIAGLRTLSRDLSQSLDASQTEAETQRVEVDRLQATYQGLVSDLESEIAEGQIEIEQLREGVRVNVSDDILFASGSAKLDKIGRELLDKVAERLVGNDYHVEVQGHTDNVAIRGVLARRYPTNWELASARASSVVVAVAPPACGRALRSFARSQ